MDLKSGGFSNLDTIERLHLKFCKYVLCVCKSTPNFMVYGELGRYPLPISVISKNANILDKCD